MIVLDFQVSMMMYLNRVGIWNIQPALADRILRYPLYMKNLI